MKQTCKKMKVDTEYRWFLGILFGEEINEERRKQGKKEFEYKEQYEQKRIKVSITDKESGYYHRDNKEKGFMYLDHRIVDHKANIVLNYMIKYFM